MDLANDQSRTLDFINIAEKNFRKDFLKKIVIRKLCFTRTKLSTNKNAGQAPRRKL
jgi:hypothetical protein